MKERKGLIIEGIKNLNSSDKQQVLKINIENNVKNGGQLHYAGILQHDFVVLAKIANKVVGYALLKSSFLADDDLYVMQVAVDKNLQHLGIGSKLYEYAYKYSKGFPYLTANVNEANGISQGFHKKMGFRHCGYNNLGMIYVRPITKEVINTLDDAKPESFDIELPNNNLEKVI